MLYPWIFLSWKLNENSKQSRPTVYKKKQLSEFIQNVLYCLPAQLKTVAMKTDIHSSISLISARLGHSVWACPPQVPCWWLCFWNLYWLLFCIFVFCPTKDILFSTKISWLAIYLLHHPDYSTLSNSFPVPWFSSTSTSSPLETVGLKFLSLWSYKPTHIRSSGLLGTTILLVFHGFTRWGSKHWPLTRLRVLVPSFLYGL